MPPATSACTSVVSGEITVAPAGAVMLKPTACPVSTSIPPLACIAPVPVSPVNWPLASVVTALPEPFWRETVAPET